MGGEIERISGDIDEAESSINLFKGQIDTLKDVAQYYYITQRKIPEIDEEILHVLELPELRYKVELKNGTIVVGDIISENLDLIVMQTTVGKLVIEKDFIQRYEERFFTGPRVEFAGNYETRQFPTGKSLSAGSRTSVRRGPISLRSRSFSGVPRRNRSVQPRPLLTASPRASERASSAMLPSSREGQGVFT